MKLNIATNRNKTQKRDRAGPNRFSPKPHKLRRMERDIFIQFLILIFTLSIFYVLQALSKRAFSKLRSKARPSNQAHRHFIQGAQLLSRARSTKTKSAAVNLARSAVHEADQALAIEPRDPAAHILKAMAQTVMGQKTAALKSLDTALSPPVVKMLSEREKGDALFKRAELQVSVNKKRRVDSAIDDLLEAVRLSRENANAFCLLGQCYEIKGLMEEARNAFQQALRIEPSLDEARENLARLGS